VKLFLVLLPAILLAQDPAKLLPVTHQPDGKWIARNTSAKTISVFFVHCGWDAMRAGVNLFAWGENAPLASGATVEVPAKPDNVAVNAVALIFTDGSVVGDAKGVDGLDLVALTFQRRAVQVATLKEYLALPDEAAVRAHLEAERDGGTYDDQSRQSMVDLVRNFNRDMLVKQLRLIEPSSVRRAR